MTRLAFVLVTVLGVALLAADPAAAQRERADGYAVWYGTHHAGKRTANGERFSAGAMTAAHRRLPFGTHVRVTNLSNGRSVVVRINDRLRHRRAVIDVTPAAARQLGLKGRAPVKLAVLAQPGG
jgi:rare lipoprotein A